MVPFPYCASTDTGVAERSSSYLHLDPASAVPAYAEYPITVLADRSLVKSVHSDINIRDSTSPVQDAPNIHVCRDDDEEQRQDFLSLKGTFTVHRELNISDWEELQPEVGKEYILRHLPGTWWWTDESIDEVMTYLGSKNSLGLPYTDCIKFLSAGEVRFKVVE